MVAVKIWLIASICHEVAVMETLHVAQQSLCSYRKRMIIHIIPLLYSKCGFEGLVLAGQTCLHLL